jgi:hypothetical protein
VERGTTATVLVSSVARYVLPALGIIALIAGVAALLLDPQFLRLVVARVRPPRRARR